jgi:hypothetical protein
VVVWFTASVITDVTADQYLAFAKADIEAETPNGALNGLGTPSGPPGSLVRPP